MKYLFCILGAWFGFANPIYQLPLLVLVFPVALTALALEAGNRKQALFRGWLAGMLSYSACLYWVALPVHNFGPLPWLLSATCPLLLGVYLGLYTGVFALIVNWAGNKLSWLLLAPYAGIIWTVLEYVRAHLLTGFPWLTLSQAFSPWPLAIQSAAYIGAFGLSGLLVVISVWLARVLQAKGALLLAILLGALVVGVGFGRMQQPLPENSKVRVAVVQGNISQSRKWDQKFQKQTVRKYLDLSRSALEDSSADLMIWPETALPFYLQEESELRRLVLDFCRKQDTPLLTGSPGYKQNNSTTKFYNRAYLISEQGRITTSYAKRHLVPFGEYVPLGSWLPFLDKLVPGIGDFTPGQRSAPLYKDDIALGPLICYEIIFPEIAQERVSKGANILVNLSNDAWFGRSSGPLQHWNQAVLRAVEQGRYLIRSTNTGISGFIDSRGRSLQKSALYTSSTQVRGVRLLSQPTPFSEKYGMLRWLYCGLAAVFVLITLGSKEKPHFKIKKI